MNPIDYALLAKRAYTDAPTVGRADSASRMHVYEVDNFGIVHAFRGSDDISCWLHDFDIAVVDTPFGKLHAGLWNAWLDIREACLSLPPPSAITGHSEGAGLAIFEAVEWAQLGHIVPVFAFEPPRICRDGILADLLKSKSLPWYATRNGNDIVTQVPPYPWTLPGPLTHIGKAVVPFDNVTDHSIDRVIRALAA